MTHQPVAAGRPSRALAFTVYIAYLASFATLVSWFIGLVLAYWQFGTGPAWLDSHYRWQIRTFWLCCLYLAIGWLLTIVLIGYVVLFLTAVWFILRCVRGLSALDRGEPIARPASWGW